jgi:hypothetical protein
VILLDEGDSAAMDFWKEFNPSVLATIEGSQEKVRSFLNHFFQYFKI